MKKFLFVSVIIISFFSGCRGMSNNPGSQDYVIIIYGTETCGLCSDLKIKMKNENIEFIFKDVSLDKEANNEMFEKLQKTEGFNGYAHYPVVDVGGEILVRPDLKRIKKAMK